MSSPTGGSGGSGITDERQPGQPIDVDEPVGEEIDGSVPSTRRPERPSTEGDRSSGGKDQYLAGRCMHCGERYAVTLLYGRPKGPANVHIDCPNCRTLNIVAFDGTDRASVSMPITAGVLGRG